MEVIVWAVIGFIVGMATYFLFFIIGTPLHELWHIITGKIFGADTSVNFWFHWRNFFKYCKRKLLFLRSDEHLVLGEVNVRWGWPRQREKFDWVVDLMGGVGSGLTIISVGVLIFNILFSSMTNLLLGFNPLTGIVTGLGAGTIAHGLSEIRCGIKEWREKK